MTTNNMMRNNTHIVVDTYVQYLPKGKHIACGDLITVLNDEYHTTVIHVDGKGSGIKANINAHLVTSRIKTLLGEKLSLQAVHQRITRTMVESIAQDLPFSAFQMIRIFRDGKVRVMGFEMPPPLIYSQGHCYPLVGKDHHHRHLSSLEATFLLKPDEYIVSLSDGIAQAGLGITFQNGWGINQIASYLEYKLKAKVPAPEQFSLLISKAMELWGGENKDDCSLIAMKAKLANVINIFTGPPSNKAKDFRFLKALDQCVGEKIVCGGTTAKMVSRHKKVPLHLEEEVNLFGLPRYHMDGIDLVTEGSITLNMVNNLLENPRNEQLELTPAVRLYEKMLEADIIHFHVGLAQNTSLNHVEFKQLDIHSRKVIIPNLVQKLEKTGKIVTVTWY